VSKNKRTKREQGLKQAANLPFKKVEKVEEVLPIEAALEIAEGIAKVTKDDSTVEEIKKLIEESSEEIIEEVIDCDTTEGPVEETPEEIIVDDDDTKEIKKKEW